MTTKVPMPGYKGGLYWPSGGIMGASLLVNGFKLQCKKGELCHETLSLVSELSLV